MFIYKLLIFKLFVLSFISLGKDLDILKKIGIIIIIILLVFIAGFRYDTGNDYNSYKNYYYRINGLSNINFKSVPFEKGFVLLISVFRTMNIDFNDFLIFISITSLLLTFISLKKYTKFYYMSFILYIFYFFLQREMGHIRVALAYSICFFSIKYLEEKKIVKWFTLYLIAISFHISSSIFILVLFLYYIKITRKQMLVLLFVAIIVGQTNFLLILIDNFRFLLPAEIVNYAFSSKFGKPYGITLGIIKTLLLFVFVVFIKKRKSIKNYYIMLILFFLNNIFFFLLNNVSIFVYRLSTIFSISEIFFIPHILFSFKRDLTKIILWIMFFGYGAYRMYNYLYIFESVYLPFVSVFTK